MTIEAKVILDSVGESSPRLTTFLLRYPKFIHAEHCRHRSMSLCVSSSRAVPVSKNLEEVRSSELRAAPVWWGKEQKGMSAAEELSDEDHTFDVETGIGTKTSRDRARHKWNSAARIAALCASELAELGAHKSIVNRLLEPFLHVNVLCTVTEPGLMNFFGLRLDKAAQPEIRTLAEQMWKCWNESTPTFLKPGDYHLPFIDLVYPSRYRTDPLTVEYMDGDTTLSQQTTIKVSVARCARLSYTSFETGKRSTIEEDLALYDRLITSRPIHASPAEHQATPDERFTKYIERTSDPHHGSYTESGWRCPHLAGNLGPGWRQYRKMLPGESVAPLPEGYRIKAKSEPG